MRAHYANIFSDDCRGQNVSAVKHALCAPYAHFGMWGVQMELWTTPLRSDFLTDRYQVCARECTFKRNCFTGVRARTTRISNLRARLAHGKFLLIWYGYSYMYISSWQIMLSSAKNLPAKSIFWICVSTTARLHMDYVESKYGLCMESVSTRRNLSQTNKEVDISSPYSLKQ